MLIWPLQQLNRIECTLIGQLNAFSQWIEQSSANYSPLSEAQRCVTTIHTLAQLSWFPSHRSSRSPPTLTGAFSFPAILTCIRLCSLRQLTLPGYILLKQPVVTTQLLTNVLLMLHAIPVSSLTSTSLLLFTCFVRLWFSYWTLLLSKTCRFFCFHSLSMPILVSNADRYTVLAAPVYLSLHTLHFTFKHLWWIILAYHVEYVRLVVPFHVEPV